MVGRFGVEGSNPAALACWGRYRLQSKREFRGRGKQRRGMYGGRAEKTGRMAARRDVREGADGGRAAGAENAIRAVVGRLQHAAGAAQTGRRRLDRIGQRAV